MRYFRLLKSTPSSAAGSIFKQQQEMYLDYYMCKETGESFDCSDVHDNTEWFEEVEQIFVRPHNAAKLALLDDLSDGVGVEIADFAIHPGAV